MTPAEVAAALAAVETSLRNAYGDVNDVWVPWAVISEAARVAMLHRLRDSRGRAVEVGKVSKVAERYTTETRPAIHSLAEQKAYEAGYDVGYAAALAPAMELTAATRVRDFLADAGDGVWVHHKPSEPVRLVGHPELGGSFCIVDGADWPCGTAREYAISARQTALDAAVKELP